LAIDFRHLDIFKNTFKNAANTKQNNANNVGQLAIATVLENIT
jgi:hypothetical protein